MVSLYPSAVGWFGMTLGIVEFALGCFIFLSQAPSKASRFLATFLVVRGITETLGLGLLFVLDGPAALALTFQHVLFAGHLFGMAMYLFLLSEALPSPVTRLFATRTARALTLLLWGGTTASQLLWPQLWTVEAFRPTWGAWDVHPGPLATIWVGFNILTSLFGLVASITALALSKPGSVERRRAKLFLGAFAAIDLTMIGGQVGMFALGLDWGPVYTFLLIGFLTAALLLFYAIMHDHIFDIDIRLKAAVNRGTLAGIIVGVFLLATLLSRRYLFGGDAAIVSAAFGLAAATSLIFFWRPLSRFADRVASAVFPAVDVTPQYYDRRKLEIYGAALAEASSVAQRSPGHDAFLRDLRQRLGVSVKEDRVLQSLVVPRRQEGSAPSPLVADVARWEAYVRALRRESTAGSSGEDLKLRLSDLRADLGISDREHALLDYALQQAPAASRSGRLAPGQLFLNRYRMRRLLDTGGSASTYLCLDEQTRREVVIKVLTSLTGDRESVAAVLKEARAMAAIHHPNVVTLYDVDVLGDEAFIIMEFLDGGNLRERIGNGPLSRDDFELLGRHLLAGLAAVHAAGLVHRDVKPSNIVFTGEGVAKVADFGIAHLPGFETTAGARSTDAVAGTIRYMSPETARGKRATVQSDLFSVGATLFEAWGGRPYVVPLEGETAMELQIRVGSMGRFPSDWKGPASMRSFFARALEPLPERRFESSLAMQAALAQALARMSRPSSASPGNPSTRRAARAKRSL